MDTANRVQGSRHQPASKRDAAATRKRIMDSARQSFALHGYSGARIDSIARDARANVQMIYRYFGSKESLYLAVLEDTYTRIRALERELDLRAMAPAEGMRRLVEFTFDYLKDNPEFVAIIRNENLVSGRFVRELPAVSESALPLVDALATLLRRGRESGVFKVRADPTQLYVTLLSLCITHLAQRDTLSVMFRRDLGDPAWLGERRAHAVDVVMTFLTAPRERDAGAPTTPDRRTP